ncbi:MAG: hypothetical protein O3B42_09305, partial [Actinomycetota bacterium]|nr:hypothetical protein [Actinomycetota bacterium]
MKIRLNNDGVRARLTVPEVHELGRGNAVLAAASPDLTFEVQVVDSPDPQNDLSGPPYRIEIPRHLVQSPGPKSPTIYESLNPVHIVVEPDLAPSHP